MKLDKLKQKLSEMFNLSDLDSSGSQENLAGIIEKLKEKKAQIKEKMQAAGEQDETSNAYRDIEKEYKVVSKLLKKAKKNYQSLIPEKAEGKTQDPG
jgi:acetate kinase